MISNKSPNVGSRFGAAIVSILLFSHPQSFSLSPLSHNMIAMLHATSSHTIPIWGKKKNGTRFSLHKTSVFFFWEENISQNFSHHVSQSKDFTLYFIAQNWLTCYFLSQLLSKCNGIVMVAIDL